MRKIKTKLPLFILGVLLLFFAFTVFYNLNATPLENWDESFYAVATRAMFRTHEFIVPYFNGQIYLDKPPLQYWITAGIASVFGLSEWVFRIPSAISSFIVMLLILKFSYKRWGIIPTVFAFPTLAFNNIYMWRSRTGNLDALTTLFFVIIFLLILNKSKYRYPLIGLSFGLLYMTKIGVVFFPIVIFIIDELITYRLKIWKNVLSYLKLVVCAIIIPVIWLYLGYLKAGQPFINYFVFNSTHGVSESISLSNLSSDYLMYAYYSLQRRFTWFLLFGLICLLIKLKNRLNYLLLLFSVIILIPLLFSHFKNNWYLMPMMPFWTLTIAFGIWQLMDWIKKLKISYLPQISSALLILFSLIIGLKTYYVNITPLYHNNTTIKQAQTALDLNKLTKENDTIIRLDYQYPVTIYYSDRVVQLISGMSHQQFLDLVGREKYTWIAGQKSDAEDVIKGLPGYKFQIIPTNDQEEIVKIINPKP